MYRYQLSNHTTFNVTNEILQIIISTTFKEMLYFIVIHTFS